MTLGDFFNSVSDNPTAPLVYFCGVPFIAFLAWFFGKGEGHQSPWKYLYSLLSYMVSIPGIFALTLSIYFFLFERRSILDMNIYTQVLPVVSMLLTLWLIRRNVDFDAVPGFDTLGSLIFINIIVISMMWILEKTHIVIFSFMPFYQFVLVFIGFLLLMRFMLKKVFG